MLKIQSHLVEGIKSAKKAADLHEYMQLAIELEHATIPPYLTAQFSLKPNKNDEIRKVIHSIVVEEMLHMTIASNVLNALGGSPDINKKAFIPNYPCPLPMHIGGDLIVGLKKYSKKQVKKVFMEIEEPEDPIEIRKLMVTAESNVEDFRTIGEFYTSMQDKIRDLDLPDDKLPGDPTKQVTSSFFSSDELFAIIHKEDAIKAIGVIIEQGEGTSTSPFDDNGELAHYYKFYELLEQRTIHPVGSHDFAFGAPNIPYDKDGVYNIVPNTKAAMLKEGTEARRNLDEFNETYCRLLNGLHVTFNGNPNFLNNTLGLMYDLKLIAQKLCATPFPRRKKKFVGPSFEYVELPTPTT